MDITVTQVLPTPELLGVIDAAEPKGIVRYVEGFSIPNEDAAGALRVLAVWALTNLASDGCNCIETLGNVIERYGRDISIADARDRLLQAHAVLLQPPPLATPSPV
jgi:hypothetical protein